eukprot:791550-Amphidinium_carterae.1
MAADFFFVFWRFWVLNLLERCSSSTQCLDWYIHLHAMGEPSTVQPAFTAAISTLTSGLKGLRLPLNAQKTQILHCSKSAGFAHRISQAHGFAAAQY